MNNSATLRRVLQVPPSLRNSLLTSQRISPIASRAYLQALAGPRSYASIPSITSTSFWTNLIPKPLRKSTSKSTAKKPSSKEWNPMTFFIVIFILIGSMSIQMIALKNSFSAFSRRADAKIGLLKEIIERVQKGEEVDVEGLLGTGDEKREKEWEEVLREIEEEDQFWEKSRKPKPKHGKNLENTVSEVKVAVIKPAAEKPAGKAPSGFY